MQTTTPGPRRGARSGSARLQLNLLAPAELATRAVAHFRARGEGGILIHLSSRAAHRGEKPLLGSYAASKGALNALSHTLARTHGGDDILSYAVAPGWVGTDMSWDYINETGDRGPLGENALGTLIPPEEVANIVTFLASGAARHATGTVIDINGSVFPALGTQTVARDATTTEGDHESNHIRSRTGDGWPVGTFGLPSRQRRWRLRAPP